VTWGARQCHRNSGRQGSCSWHQALRPQALPITGRHPRRRGARTVDGTQPASFSAAPSHSLRM